MSSDARRRSAHPIAVALAVSLFGANFAITAGNANAATYLSSKACSKLMPSGANMNDFGQTDLTILQGLCPSRPPRTFTAQKDRPDATINADPTHAVSVAPVVVEDRLAAHVPVLNPEIRAVFVSRDSISTLGEFAYPQFPGKEGIPILSPLGASVTGSIDELKKTQSVSVQGYLGICVICGATLPVDASFSVGPAILADGSLSNPIAAKSAVTPSALRTGPDIAVNFENLLGHSETSLNLHTDVLPFYQTDFRGNARMSGVQVLAEPSSNRFHLGTNPCGDPASPTYCVFGYIVRLIPEADIVNVSNVGQTFYAKPGSYNYLGGNARLTINLFGDMTPDEVHLAPPIFQFLSSLSTTVMYKYLANVGTGGGRVDSLLGEIDYHLGQGVTNPNGFAAISLSYQAGYDELTLQNQKVFKLALSYKY